MTPWSNCLLMQEELSYKLVEAEKIRSLYSVKLQKDNLNFNFTLGLNWMHFNKN